MSSIRSFRSPVRPLGPLTASALLLALAACGDSTTPASADGSVPGADGAPGSDATIGQDGAPSAPSDAGDADGADGSDADGSGTDGSDADGDSDAASGPSKKCVVFLHGKSGSGFATQDRGDFFMLGPTGNADGWGGKQWIYFPDSELQTVQQIVGQIIGEHACTDVVIHGFSNGGAAAAKLYCRGNDFGGKVRGYVVDDPVPDHGADNCAPAAGVNVRLYWTGGLAPADGWNCAEGDWTCEGGQTIGIDKYATALGTTAVQSVQTGHAPYETPPEYAEWL